MAEKYLIRLDGEADTLELERTGGETRIRREAGGSWKTVDLAQVGQSGLYLLMVDDHPVELYLERRRGGAIVTIGRHTFNCDVGAWRPAAAQAATRAAASGVHHIQAPMTGSIVEVRCAAGDTVQQGQVLLVIESMKMNNELRSPTGGRIELVSVAPGQRVKQGEALITIDRG